jgi:hypothetical protein
MKEPQARPIHHRKRDSIEAHLTMVFAALAVSRRIEEPTGWSIRKIVKTARRYRTIDRALTRGRRLRGIPPLSADAEGKLTDQDDSAAGIEASAGLNAAHPAGPCDDGRRRLRRAHVDSFWTAPRWPQSGLTQDQH